MVELPFTVHIGKDLKEIQEEAFGSCYGFTAEGHEVLYHITLTVDCDPANKTFYSENGVLYERATGKPVLGTAGGTP